MFLFFIVLLVIFLKWNLSCLWLKMLKNWFYFRLVLLGYFFFGKWNWIWLLIFLLLKLCILIGWVFWVFVYDKIFLCLWVDMWFLFFFIFNFLIFSNLLYNGFWAYMFIVFFIFLKFLFENVNFLSFRKWIKVKKVLWKELIIEKMINDI